MSGANKQNNGLILIRHKESSKNIIPLSKATVFKKSTLTHETQTKNLKLAIEYHFMTTHRMVADAILRLAPTITAAGNYRILRFQQQQPNPTTTTAAAAEAMLQLRDRLITERQDIIIVSENL
jgi:hypothetical protein